MEVLEAKTKNKLDPQMALELKVKQNMCFPLLLETYPRAGLFKT